MSNFRKVSNEAFRGSNYEDNGLTEINGIIGFGMNFSRSKTIKIYETKQFSSKFPLENSTRV